MKKPKPSAVRNYINALVLGFAPEETPNETVECKRGTWTWKHNGRVFGRWKEESAPGLGRNLKLAMRAFTWAVDAALAAAYVYRAQKFKGSDGGKRIRVGTFRERLVKQARRTLDNGDEPNDYVADWAAQYGCAPKTVKRAIDEAKRILDK